MPKPGTRQYIPFGSFHSDPKGSGVSARVKAQRAAHDIPFPTELVKLTSSHYALRRVNA